MLEVCKRKRLHCEDCDNTKYIAQQSCWSLHTEHKSRDAVDNLTLLNRCTDVHVAAEKRTRTADRPPRSTAALEEQPRPSTAPLSLFFVRVGVFVGAAIGALVVATAALGEAVGAAVSSCGSVAV